MNGVPVGSLLTIAVVATVLAALLSAGETAVLRSAPSGAVIPEKLGAVARRRRLLADAHGTAGAAAGVGVVCQVIAAVSLTVALMGTGLAWWLVLLTALVLVGVLALVVVRFLPRTLGYRYPGVTLLLTSGPLAVARVVARPLRGVVAVGRHPLSDAELRAVVDRATESELIEDEEGEMFRSVLGLGDTITRAVMVPRTEMITLPSGTPLRKALALFVKSGYSRVPVVGSSVDDVRGVLYLKACR